MLSILLKAKSVIIAFFKWLYDDNNHDPKVTLLLFLLMVSLIFNYRWKDNKVEYIPSAPVTNTVTVYKDKIVYVDPVTGKRVDVRLGVHSTVKFEEGKTIIKNFNLRFVPHIGVASGLDMKLKPLLAFDTLCYKNSSIQLACSSDWLGIGVSRRLPYFNGMALSAGINTRSVIYAALSASTKN
jgi:hypothetical protein